MKDECFSHPISVAYTRRKALLFLLRYPIVFMFHFQVTYYMRSNGDKKKRSPKPAIQGLISKRIRSHLGFFFLCLLLSKLFLKSGQNYEAQVRKSIPGPLICSSKYKKLGNNLQIFEKRKESLYIKSTFKQKCCKQCPPNTELGSSYRLGYQTTRQHYRAGLEQGLLTCGLCLTFFWQQH